MADDITAEQSEKASKVNEDNGTNSEDNMNINESTCEKILSSINEQCIKISQGKENGLNSYDEEMSELPTTNGKDKDIGSKNNSNPVNDNSANNSMKVLNKANDDISMSDSDLQSKENNLNDESEKEKEVNTGNGTSNSKDVENSTNIKVVEPNKEDVSKKDDSKEKDNSKSTESVSGGNDKDISISSPQHSLVINEDDLDKDSSNDSSDKDGAGVKIKLRSFASLCSDNDTKQSKNGPKANLPSEVSGVSVGDIVQHGNNVESDESGMMHLKISNVVGGEDCITGLTVEEEKDPMIQVSISTVIESDQTSLESSADSNKEDNKASSDSEDKEKKSPDVNEDSESNSKLEKSETIVNIFMSPLIVNNSCLHCKKKTICKYRVVIRQTLENKTHFICSDSCKSKAEIQEYNLMKVQKPRLYFERICGKCGKEITNADNNFVSNVFSWQTREFCNKLCLADHIGEVAQSCFACNNVVHIQYMVKYCVRFGSDVHQFCANKCLEKYKSSIKVCAFCQKNLTNVSKVTSQSSNKEYCTVKCLKRAQRRDISQQHYKEVCACTVCNQSVINKFEYVQRENSTLLCSETCLKTFKYVSKVKTVNCCLCARLLNAEDSCNYFFNGKQLRVFCSESCFSVFVISARKIVACEYCKVKKYNFDMIHSSSSSSVSSDYYTCSICCLNYVENATNSKVSLAADVENRPPLPVIAPAPAPSSEAVTTAPVVKECNMCSKVKSAQFHMVMSDSTLRSFCSYDCATMFKNAYGFHVSGAEMNQNKGIPPAASRPKDVSTLSLSDEGSKKVAVDSPKLQSKLSPKNISGLMQFFNPPRMSNKATMCKPIPTNMVEKDTQCSPSKDSSDGEKTVSTSEPKTLNGIIPVPVPVYVPSPMMMFSAPTPVPLVIPFPVPIPVFIPTSEKTTQDLEKTIRGIFERIRNEKSDYSMCVDSKEPKSPPLPEDKERAIALDDISDTSLSPRESTGGSPPPNLSPLDAISGGDEFEMIAKIEATIPKLSSLVEVPDYSDSPASSPHSDSEESPTKRKRSCSSDAPRPKRPKVMEEQLDLSCGVGVWKRWAGRRGDVQEDPSELDAVELADALSLFLADLDGRIEIDTLFYLLLGIQKYIFEQESTFCIFLEHNCESFTTAFDEMITRLAFSTQADLVSTRLLQGTRVTEEMMWEARQLGAHTPHVLLNTLFYFNTKTFLLKTPEDHLNLKSSHIIKEWVSNKENPEQSGQILKYSHQDIDDEGSSSEELKMQDNKVNPLRCPVKLYEFYLSKCPESVRGEMYYVYPEESCLPDSSVWFSSAGLEREAVAKRLNRILLVREVQDALFPQ